ncbi:MAG: DUF3293 domain-containing protein [Gemmatimonadaceae bacterium]
MPSSDDAAWGDFPRTILHFADAHCPSVDLRQEVSREAICALIRLDLDGPFGVVTALDPMGLTQSVQRHHALAAELEREIAAMGVPFVLLDACSPDRSHCERSIAVAAPRSRVVEIACRYEQLAIFWFDGSSFWIVPARSTGEQLRLPVADRAGSLDG